MLLKDNWYVVAWSAELEPGATLARRVCNQALVLLRTATGAIAALVLLRHKLRCVLREVMRAQQGHLDRVGASAMTMRRRKVAIEFGI